MTEQNPAEKLAEEIVNNLSPRDVFLGSPNGALAVGKCLQPTFYLLKRIHRLAKEARGFSQHHDYHFPMVEEIENLTREYDNET